MGNAPSAPLLKDINVKKGQDILFSWKANCGVNGKWLKGDQRLENSDRIEITQSSDKLHFKLTIRGAREMDQGEYTLVLWNSKGTVTGFAKVNVLEYDVDWRKLDWQKNVLAKEVLGNFKPSNPATHLRFMLHGPVGAGKSSLINSINCVFQGRTNMVAPVATNSGTSFTKAYVGHKIKNHHGRVLPFVFNDVMGQESKEKCGVLMADIISAIKGHIKEGYKFNPLTPLSGGDAYNSNPTVNDKVHCVVGVIPADKISLLKDTDGVILQMRKVREAVSDLGIPHIVIMTHVDMCCPLVKEDLTHIYSSKRIKQAMQDCSNKLGVPMNCIFPVKNYHEENCVEKKMDCLILDALQIIVNFANDYIMGKDNE